MSETKITFLGDGKIEGWADTQEIVNNFQTLPDSLWWKEMPVLTQEFQPSKIVGTITKLEYRDGNLWCEATLNEYGAPWARWPNMRFGVKVLMGEYEFVSQESEEDLLIIKRSELLEIGILAIDKGEIAP